MNSSNLQIMDALQGAIPGTLVASPETTKLHGPLRALIGKDAASRVSRHAGRAGVLHMTAEELTRVAGIEPELAERLVSARRLFAAAHQPRPTLWSSRHVLDALPAGLADLEVEILLAVALDAGLAPLGTVLLAQGGPTGAAILPRYVFTPLVRLGARQFVLVQNHPSGNVTPSRDDVVTTSAIAKLGFAFDLQLVDHLIVGGSDVASFSDLGLLPTRQELQSLEMNDVL